MSPLPHPYIFFCCSTFPLFFPPPPPPPISSVLPFVAPPPQPPLFPFPPPPPWPPPTPRTWQEPGVSPRPPVFTGGALCWSPLAHPHPPPPPPLLASCPGTPSCIPPSDGVGALCGVGGPVSPVLFLFSLVGPLGPVGGVSQCVGRGSTVARCTGAGGGRVARLPGFFRPCISPSRRSVAQKLRVASQARRRLLPRRGASALGGAELDDAQVGLPPCAVVVLLASCRLRQRGLAVVASEPWVGAPNAMSSGDRSPSA